MSFVSEAKCDYPIRKKDKFSKSTVKRRREKADEETLTDSSSSEDESPKYKNPKKKEGRQIGKRELETTQYGISEGVDCSEDCKRLKAYIESMINQAQLNMPSGFTRSMHKILEVKKNLFSIISHTPQARHIGSDVSPLLAVDPSNKT